MIKYWYEMNDNECSIFCEFGDYSSDGQVCYGINREKLATITKEAFTAMFERWIMNPVVEQYCINHVGE